MIDSQTEDMVPFQEASRYVPGRPSLAALHRWRLNGVRGVRLETLLIGGKRFTSRQAIARMIAEQNRDETPTPAFTPKQRRTQAEAANRLLQEAGI